MSYGRPKKRFSQNFLIDLEIASKIVKLLNIQPDDIVFEIGTGRGALTRIIAETGAKLYSFELDRPLFEKIEKELKVYPNIEIINKDFLTVVPSDYTNDEFKLIGNIPYDITSPLIDWIINQRDQITKAVITTQKELAERISSGPGSKDWAPISIFSRFYYDLKYEFTIKPTAFFPPPNVQSATISFENRPNYQIEDEPFFKSIVRSAFKHRRKLLIKNLTKELNLDRDCVTAIVQEIGLDENIRAEAVSIEQFIALSARLKSAINS